MSRVRANSSPDLIPRPTTTAHESNQQFDDSALEGVAAHIKLLLKLIEDHKEACNKDQNSPRRMLRVATMMTILDTVRTRLQRSQSFGKTKSEPQLRRCDTAPRHKLRQEDNNNNNLVSDEKEKLRKEFNARKRLEIVCSSLGKEKEIMAGELSRKAHELTEMEELVEDLRARNESLLGKLKQCTSNLEGKSGESRGIFALQERNKELSEKLLRSVEGYRALKGKLKEAREEKLAMRGAMEETGEKFEAVIRRIHSFKENDDDLPGDVREEISNLENIFSEFCNVIAVKHD